MASAISEIAAGRRFAFGRNWARFLGVLNDDRIVEAERSLKEMLNIESLQGKSFLDIGSGSGLFSLAARRLGADVYSFDFDPYSVACTNNLRQRFFNGDHQWIVSEGSVLNEAFMSSLGKYDIVYAWGVLHHTGQMWRALENAALKVKPQGHLFLMIYLDHGIVSDFWRLIKKSYCSSRFGKILVLSIFIPYYILAGIAADIFRLKNPVKRYSEYKKRRGMSKIHDIVDWLGGYPYETAKPKEVIELYGDMGLGIIRYGGMDKGYVEYLFKKDTELNPTS